MTRWIFSENPYGLCAIYTCHSAIPAQDVWQKIYEDKIKLLEDLKNSAERNVVEVNNKLKRILDSLNSYDKNLPRTTITVYHTSLTKNDVDFLTGGKLSRPQEEAAHPQTLQTVTQPQEVKQRARVLWQRRACSAGHLRCSRVCSCRV
jgi:hypothetical protein